MIDIALSNSLEAHYTGKFPEGAPLIVPRCEPIVTVDSMSLPSHLHKRVGVELVARLEDGKEGVYGPGAFLGYTETDPVRRSQLDSVMIGHAARLASERVGPFHVNVSIASLRGRDCVNAVLQVVDQYSIDPSRIGIEVLESCGCPDRQCTVPYTTDCLVELQPALGELADMGVRICLDDRGTDTDVSPHEAIPVMQTRSDFTDHYNILKRIQAIKIDRHVTNDLERLYLATLAAMKTAIKKGIIEETLGTQRSDPFLIVCEGMAGHQIAELYTLNAWLQSALTNYKDSLHCPSHVAVQLCSQSYAYTMPLTREAFLQQYDH